MAGHRTNCCIVAAGPGVTADINVHSPDEVRVCLARDMHEAGRRRVNADQAGVRRQRRCIADARGVLGRMATTESSAHDNAARPNAMDGCRGKDQALAAPNRVGTAHERRPNAFAHRGWQVAATHLRL